MLKIPGARLQAKTHPETAQFNLPRNIMLLLVLTDAENVPLLLMQHFFFK